MIELCNCRNGLVDISLRAGFKSLFDDQRMRLVTDLEIAGSQ